MIEEPLRRRRHHRHENPFWRWIKANWIEGTLALLFILAIFLLFEQMNIRLTLLTWARSSSAAIIRDIGHLDDTLRRLASRIGLSEIIGAFLLCVIAVAAIARLRWRLRQVPALTDVRCPHCGGATLHRVHRHFLDRVISLAVPMRRYYCANRDCQWSGMRVYTHTHRGHTRPSDA